MLAELRARLSSLIISFVWNQFYDLEEFSLRSYLAPKSRNCCLQLNESEILLLEAHSQYRLDFLSPTDLG